MDNDDDELPTILLPNSARLTFTACGDDETAQLLVIPLICF